MRMPMGSKDHADLYQAFNKALGEAAPKGDSHPYETKLAFQVWNRRGEVLVHTASAPSFSTPPSTPGFSDVVDLTNHHWRAFMLEDKQNDLRIWVGERDDVRSDLADRIVRHTLWPNVLGSLILAAMIWIAIDWGLKPLENMAATLRARHRGSLLQLIGVLVGASLLAKAVYKPTSILNLLLPSRAGAPERLLLAYC